MRLIDADALKEKKVYSHERHEKIVPVADIDWSPTIAAIPVEWLRSQLKNNPNDIEYAYDDICINELIDKWQKEQEAR